MSEGDDGYTVNQGRQQKGSDLPTRQKDKYWRCYATNIVVCDRYPVGV